jgi:hypothetical protein
VLDIERECGARLLKGQYCSVADVKLHPKPKMNEINLANGNRTYANTESPSMKKITRYIDQLANRIIRNGPAQTRTHHQVDDQVTLTYHLQHRRFLFIISYPPWVIDPNRFPFERLVDKSCERRQIGKKLTNNVDVRPLRNFPVTTAD